MSDKEQARVGYVYILSNERRSVIYIGSTSNLSKRVYAHQKGLIPGFTKKYNVKRLVYFEQHSSIEEARLREKYLKGKTRAKKIKLIESSNPEWNDLTQEIPK